MKKNNLLIVKTDFDRLYPNGLSLLRRFKVHFTSDLTYKKYKYMKYMRLSDSLSYNGCFFEKLLKLYFQRKKNKLALLFNFEINSNNIGKGLLLYHNDIIINGNSIIGSNCSFHGQNCVGNNGKDDLCPVIGDNVEIGVGAKIIGNINIADDVVIGAGSVVVSDINVKGAIVCGVPAKIIKRR